MRAGLAVVAGAAVALLSTLLISSLQLRYANPLVFLYMPGILAVSYYGTLLAGITGAVVGTLLVLGLFVEPVGLAWSELRAGAFPSLLFLISGTLIAVAGHRYRLSQKDLRRDLARSRRRARHEAFLVRIGDAVMAGVEQGALQTISQESARTLGTACAIVLAGRDAADLLVAAFASHAGDGQAQRLAVDQIIADRTSLLRAPSRPILRSYDPPVLVAPLGAGDDLLGYLMIVAASTSTWDDEDRRLAQAVADRIAAALHHHRLAEQRRRREREARLLADIALEFSKPQEPSDLFSAIARRCTDVFGEWCGVLVVEPDRPWLVPVALHHHEPEKVRRVLATLERVPLAKDNPLVRHIMERRAPLALTSAEQVVDEHVPRIPALGKAFAWLGVQGALAIPICAGGDALGILAVGAETPRQWDEDELRLASLIADRAGAAIQNARLMEAERRAREQAEREARHTSAVNRIIAIAALSLNLREVFDEFTEALQMLVPFTRVTVSLYVPESDSLTMPHFKGPRLTAPPERLEGPKAGTVRGWVIDHGQAYIRTDTLQAKEFEEDHVLAEAGIRSYAVIPMTVGGKVIGTLNFGYYEPGFYTERHTRLVQPIADQLGLTISRFQLLEQAQRRAGELAETLQRALLPVDVPRVPFTAIGTAYRPADEKAGIGGDWLDAMLLSDDAVMLSIGDVAGRGLQAAVSMGQVRHVVRAYALEGRSPSEVLTTLNHFVCTLPGAPQMSMWVARVNPFSGELVYGGAGHPPALILRDGQASFVSTGGPPLGLAASTVYAEERLRLAPGSRLLAYTDGLTESTHDPEKGEQWLVEAAQSMRDVAPGRAADLLIDRMLAGVQPMDDVALLIVDLLPVDAPLWMTLPALPENLGRIRRAVRAFADRAGLSSDRLDEVVTAVGEAALNVVEHAYSGAIGSLALRGEIRGTSLSMTVADSGQWRPPDPHDRGLGTRIMQAFADGVRVMTTRRGTVVELSWRLDPARSTSFHALSQE